MVSPYDHLTGSRKSESPTKHIAPPPPPHIFCVMSFNAFWTFLWLRNSEWEFLGLKFWSRDFFGFCLKP